MILERMIEGRAAGAGLTRILIYDGERRAATL
jgi:hypothetical protein